MGKAKSKLTPAVREPSETLPETLSPRSPDRVPTPTDRANPLPLPLPPRSPDQVLSHQVVLARSPRLCPLALPTETLDRSNPLPSP